MGLYMDLKITKSGLSMENLGGLEITRQGALLNPKEPQNETHTYKASIWKSGRLVKGPVSFTHRYGDGAWMCVRRALEALES